MKDVKEIHDIPRIELHLEKVFTLLMYEGIDKLQIYTYEVNSSFFFNLEINSNEHLIKGDNKLIDLITQDNIEYLQFSLINKFREVAVDSYCYRPLVKESKKDYSWIEY